MTYTMTFDASHKVGRGGSHVKGFFRHVARDVDERAGFQFGHTNPNIDRERTLLNETLIADGQGGFRAPQSIDGRPPSDEFEDLLQRRLSTVTRPLRKDAVLLRPLILQLDPKWFDEHCPDWRTSGMNPEAGRYTAESLAWAVDEFGQDNVLGFSVHLDEHSPQVHVFVTPVTDDGRLSQKDFFKGPTDLKRQRGDLLDRMAAVGYDVERRPRTRSRERLSSEEFAAKADRLREAGAEAELEVKRAKAQRARAEAEASSVALERAALEQERQQIQAQAADLEARTAAVAEQQRALRAALEHVDERTDVAERLLAGTTNEAVPLVVDAFLDQRVSSSSDRTFRDLFAGFSSRLRKDPALQQQVLAQARQTKQERVARRRGAIAEVQRSASQLRSHTDPDLTL